MVTRYEPEPDNPDSITFPDVWRLIEGRQDPNILWIGTYGGGLDKFDKITATFIHYSHDPNVPTSFSARGNNVDALIQDKDDPNILWIGTPEDGLDKFDKRTEIFSNYPETLTNGEVALIYDDGKGTLWLGGYVMNTGLTLFHKQTETFTNYKHHPADPKSLGNDLVVNVYEDRAGIFWITAYSDKVDKIDPAAQNFTTYQSVADIPASLSDSAVTSIYEDRSGVMWIGTQRGLNVFYREINTFTRYLHDPDNSNSLDVDYVLGTYEDSAEDFRVSLYVGPLTKFDRAAGKVIARYPTETESFTKILEDPHNPDILWLGTHMAGLAKFDKRSEIFTFYPPDPNAPQKGPSNTYIQTLFHSRKADVIWCGGNFGGGLNKFDKRTERFTHYLTNPTAVESIFSDAIAAIYQTASGMLWIGTKGGGVNALATCPQPV
ncbi:hypothetical protein U27_01259 [Candidatus Vecturithrix granuli]|uniref:Uncharacterized protein n=1 Tax=Vecturithrix granuli TaxID=1499967 RepID=A0A081C9V4_VECG1|nr:hypothetical protein U27_01259 [Candidatus Vecturithrix granuli]